MQILARSTALLALAVLGGCSSASIHADFDSSVDFDSYRTFSWFTEPESGEGYEYSGPLDERIKSAVDEELKAKGLLKASTNTDLFVAYHVAKRERVEVERWGYGGWWGTGGGEAYSYDEGTLVIDVVDATTRKVVWRGTATGFLEKDATPEERQERIDEAVRKMFSDYPPSR